MLNLARFCTTLDYDREYLWNGWRYLKSVSTTIPPALDGKSPLNLVHLP